MCTLAGRKAKRLSSLKKRHYHKLTAHNRFGELTDYTFMQYNKKALKNGLITNFKARSGM